MPLPSLASFPPPARSTALLHLLAHPAVHPEKSDAETEARLDRPGLFLIRTLPSSACLLLSVRVEKSVVDFDITIDEDFGLVLSDHRVGSLDMLIAHAIKVGFAYHGSILRMEHCVQRVYAREIPIGHWEHAKLVPRACKKRFSDDGRLPCALLAPPSKISRALSDEELEELVKMKHDALLHLDDYTRLSDAMLLLKFAPFEISLGAYLRAHESTSIVQRLAWICKTVSALSFLMDRDPTCSVLLTGETLVLQDVDSLQLKFVHLGGQVDAKEHWRWMAPEMIDERNPATQFSPSSLVWQLAVLLWQTFTDFSMRPFENLLMSDCLSSQGRALQPATACPLLVLPHSLTAAEAASPLMRRLQPNYRAMDRFAAAPANINSLFSACFVFAPASARATWSVVTRIVEAEYKIARLAKIIDKVTP